MYSEFISCFTAKPEPFDFCQIIGSCTEDGRLAGASWDHMNLADGSHKRTQELACYFIEFHRTRLNVPNFEGLLEPSASLANYRALELARQKTGRNKILCSTLSHISVARACASLGLEPIVLDIDKNSFQIDDLHIAQAISNHGKDIAAVVSTYGTTQLGHIEQLGFSSQIQQLRNEGVWLHIDAAYGGYYATFSTTSRKHLPPADSITLDPYKCIGKPGVALLLLDPAHLSQSSAPYYISSPYTHHTTLSAGPIAAWAQTLRDCGGYCGVREIVDQCTSIARHSALALQHKGVPLLCFPELSIVPITYTSCEELVYVHTSLRESGFSVGKISIPHRDAPVYGIRIVITPKVNPEKMYSKALDLVKKISMI